MPHPSHKLKCYTGDVHLPLVFCSECGVEEMENSMDLPCVKTFYVPKLDTKIEKLHTPFVSGLPY